MYTFGSLFAGIGGIDLGFERAGLKCKWQVEIDDYATQVLEKNWPNVARWRDVKTFPPQVEKKWDVDVIAGGFPCQDISTAGRGEGLQGERSGLFYEIIRLVRQLKPRAIVLENVAALLARGMGDVLGELAEVGYDSEWHCIPAASVGAPHVRDRVFIIAVLGNANCSPIQGSGLSGGIRQKYPNINSYSFGRRKQILADSYGERQSGQGVHGGRVSKEENQRRKANRTFSGGKGKENHWYIEPDVGRVANGVPRRMDRLKCLGNAVVPQVAEVVAKILLTKLEEMDASST